jgi:hypothetical protein
MSDCFIRLGLSLAVIALITVLFYQFSSRPAVAVAPPMDYNYARVR